MISNKLFLPLLFLIPSFDCCCSTKWPTQPPHIPRDGTRTLAAQETGSAIEILFVNTMETPRPMPTHPALPLRRCIVALMPIGHPVEQLRRIITKNCARKNGEPFETQYKRVRQLLSPHTRYLKLLEPLGQDDLAMRMGYKDIMESRLIYRVKVDMKVYEDSCVVVIRLDYHYPFFICRDHEGFNLMNPTTKSEGEEEEEEEKEEEKGKKKVLVWQMLEKQVRPYVMNLEYFEGDIFVWEMLDKIQAHLNKASQRSYLWLRLPVKFLITKHIEECTVLILPYLSKERLQELKREIRVPRKPTDEDYYDQGISIIRKWLPTQGKPLFFDGQHQPCSPLKPLAGPGFQPCSWTVSFTNTDDVGSIVFFRRGRYEPTFSPVLRSATYDDASFYPLSWDALDKAVYFTTSKMGYGSTQIRESIPWEQSKD